MRELQDIAGVVLAGGAGSRIGGDKALLPFGGATLLDAVLARARPQVGVLAVSVPRASAPAYRAHLGKELPLLFDAGTQSIGPLAGIVAGLQWLAERNGPRRLASFPCDTPFLPRDLVAQLLAGATSGPVAAKDRTGLHGVCALWPLGCLPRLKSGVEDGSLRSIRSALDALGGTTCEIACDENAFFNVNTREDLAKAEAMAASVARSKCQ